MSHLRLELVYGSPLWKEKEEWQALFERAAHATLAAAGQPHAEPQLCLFLSDDTAIAAQNRRWRDKMGPTNVLSFPAIESLRHKGQLGDIMLSYETLAREANEQDKLLQNHALHLFVHGLLHLLGHDHQTEDEASLMEALERKILLELEVRDPYEER